MWRETAAPLRVLGCDYRVLFPLALWGLHMAWWTLYTSLVCIVAFAIVERLGLTVPSALRAVRSLIAGRVRPALKHHKRRRLA